MAGVVKRVGNNSFFLFRTYLNSVCARSFQQHGIRHLYSPAALGLNKYIESREYTKQQFGPVTDSFLKKMRDFAAPASTNMIFTEDLKNVLSLVEAKPEDMELIKNMIKRFCQQNKNIRFGSFVFGPVVMRMYHYLNKPVEALSLFKDPEVGGFFDQLTSFQILMDLLYQNQMYESVLEVMDIVVSKQLQNAKYPKNVVVLAMAALYKMNSKESFDRASKLWDDLQSVGHSPMRRASTYIAALALNQNAPHIALEILSTVKFPTYVTVRNIKIAALADLNRPEDALPLLRSILEAETQVKLTVSREVIDKVKEAIKRSEKSEISFEFEQLEKRLLAGEHIDNKSFDEQLCTEINMRPDARRNRDDFLAASFNRRSRPPLGVSNLVRDGLSERY